jgi:hydrogenase maturation protein HypF
MSDRQTRRLFDLTGVVQGVGFRPAVYRLARAAGLRGWIQNRNRSVRVCLSGDPNAVESFMRALPEKLPPNARIDSIHPVEDHLFRSADAEEFSILDSAEGDGADVTIPADLAICADCAREVLDPHNRRYGYPFITCANCGPRYTVVNGMPYDRERTTMSVFPLCAKCRTEYENAADRRFRAETIACPDCGPRLSVHNAAGDLLTTPSPLACARRALADGRIVALRGVGGFLLACDAGNSETLAELRRRKTRPDKPFAVMARNIATLRRLCAVPPEAESMLASSAAPIVILDLLPGSAARMDTRGVSPDSDTIGLMLPSSPLQVLLFEPLRGDPVPPFEFLVMTSGNRGGEPICLTDEEAFERLGGIADMLLCHNRDINLRNDDSLCAVQMGSPQVWRRARGFAPEPVRLSRPLSRCVLGMGAEMKNAIAMGYEDKVVLSPHIGDLENPEACRSLERTSELLPSFLGRSPELVAVDLHPDMHATMLGIEIARRLDVRAVEVQHHHAHAAAVLAENGRSEGLCLLFDGTGLGTDGSVWGAELLLLEENAARRLATFAAAPLPGGDAAVLRPARQVVGRCAAAGMDIGTKLRSRLGITEEEMSVWKRQCRTGVNTPLSHAAGRVFDSVSALLGIAPVMATYDGQAAIRLETAAGRFSGSRPDPLPFAGRREGGMFVIDWSGAIHLLADAVPDAQDVPRHAMAFHHAIAAAAEEMVRYGFSTTPHRCVGLSGGVFMNRILTDLLAVRLRRAGAEVLVHRNTPPNDGAIALGQVAVAGRNIS